MNINRRSMLKLLSTVVSLSFIGGSLKILIEFFNVSFHGGGKKRVLLGKFDHIVNSVNRTPVGWVIDHKNKLLIRTDKSKKTGIAVFSLACTHLQCTLRAKKNTLACPCHGSKFSLMSEEFGTVLQGPAEKPLEEFSTVLVKDRVYYEIS